MGKNFAVDEAVVGKIKRNLICSRSVAHVVGACHKCPINFKWSNDTTSEGKVEGVHKDGLVGEIRCTKSRRVVIVVRMLNKVVQRPLLVTQKATASHQ